MGARHVSVRGDRLADQHDFGGIPDAGFRVLHDPIDRFDPSRREPDRPIEKRDRSSVIATGSRIDQHRIVGPVGREARPSRCSAGRCSTTASSIRIGKGSYDRVRPARLACPTRPPASSPPSSRRFLVAAIRAVSASSRRPAFNININRDGRGPGLYLCPMDLSRFFVR